MPPEQTDIPDDEPGDETDQDDGPPSELKSTAPQIPPVDDIMPARTEWLGS